jgi:hypothetical protein
VRFCEPGKRDWSAAIPYRSSVDRREAAGRGDLNPPAASCLNRSRHLAYRSIVLHAILEHTDPPGKSTSTAERD